MKMLPLKVLRPFFNRRPVILTHSHQFTSVTQFQRAVKDSEHIAQTLRRHVGEKNVSFAEVIRSQHGQDEGPEKGEMPDVVVFAESTQHVSEVISLQNHPKRPVII